MARVRPSQLSIPADPLSGGGVSPYEPQPTYQRNNGLSELGQAMRTTPDVSWADVPAGDLGMPIYDSFGSSTPLTEE